MKLPAASKITIAAIVGLILFTSGYFLAKINQPKQEHITEGKIKHQTGFTYISPLLECALSDTNLETVKDLERDIRASIEAELKSNNVDNISLYFHNLSNDTWISINRSDRFSPASLLKVPLMIAFLKKAESDPSLLSREIKMEESDQSSLPVNIPPQKKVIVGETYTIEEYIRYAVNYSDNSAVNVLLRSIDPNFLESIYTDIGLPIPGFDQPENYMSVRDYASFFEVLYNASYLNPEMSEKALKILTQSTYSDALVAGVPAGVEVAHKFGERVLTNTRQLHDCGIIYKENNPYLLCVMTRSDLTAGNNFQELEAIIANISLQTYNFLNK